MTVRTLLISLVTLAFVFPAQAQVPTTLGYQGYLTDNSNIAVTDGSYSVAFNLYTSASGGSALWTETQSVTTSGGVFTATLGSTTPITLNFDQQYYLGIAISGGSELSPRVALTPSAYSFIAKNIEDNAVTSSKIVDGAIVSADLASNAITSDKITDGAIANADLAADAVTSAKISDGTVTSADITDATLSAGDINTGQVVKSLNALTDAVTLAAGTNVTITPSGNTLTFSASGSGGLADNEVTTTKILDGAVGNADLGADAVTSAKIADGTIVSSDLADGSITSAKLVDGTIATVDITDSGITSIKIADGSIASVDIANNAITAGLINDGTIQAADIGAAQVVKSVNSLTDAVTLAAGSNVTITPAGNTLTIAASSSAANTLDQAYDQGGAGVGRTITADNGAVDIAGAGGLTVNGNVGLGTTSPGQLLDLNNAGSAGTVYPLRLVNNTTATTNTGVGIEFGFQSGTQILSKIESVHQGSSVTDLIFYTQNTSVAETMRIKGTGNVGIGTITPSAKLEVPGDILVGGSQAAGKAVYAPVNDHLTLVSGNGGGAGIRFQSGTPADVRTPRIQA